MGDFDFTFSHFNFLVFILLGILLFAAFRVLHYVIRHLLSKNRHIDTLKRVLPLGEGIVWFLFWTWALKSIFEEQLIYSLGVLVIVLVVLVWVSWFAIKDFIAGVVLKFEAAFQEGEQINIENVVGVVKYLGYFSLEIQTEQGEKINIPYSSISGQVRRKLEDTELFKSYSFELSIAKDKNIPDIFEKLRITSINAPWTSINKLSQFHLLEEDSNFYNFKIVIYSLDTKYFQAIKNYIQTNL